MKTYTNDQREHGTTFYCVFCKNVKDNAEHGGRTKASHDDICQSCLDRDGPPATPREPASLDSLDQMVLRDMIVANWGGFVAACDGYEGYDPHKLFAKIGGRHEVEDVTS